MRHERIAANDVQARLAHALVASAVAAGVEASVTEQRQRPWASATFVGAHHDLTLVALRYGGDCKALDDWLAALPEVELPLRGHVVASLVIERVEYGGTAVAIALSVLTIEEG